MRTVLTNGNVFTGGKIQHVAVAIENQRIVEIGPDLQGDNFIDLGGKTVLPGMIDTHVHFRFPGGEHKEDWRTGSKAALAGGTTTVYVMPNTSPAIVTQESLDMQRERAERESAVNYGIYLGATKGNVETRTDADAIKAYYGSSTGDLLLDSILDIHALFRHAKAPVVVHSEHEALIRYYGKKFRETEDHLRMRPNLAAAVSTAELIDVANAYGTRLHIAHMSTREEVDILRALKNESITCEVTPQHLLLTHAYCNAKGNRGKMNPPLRTAEDQQALWDAIADGTVDMVVTDHAPHTYEEKCKPFHSAPCGMPGVQTRLALMLDQVAKGRLTIARVVDLCATGPARIFGIKGRGSITEGHYADLVVVDMERKMTITDEQQHSKCGWTPFEGAEVIGWPVMTFVNGSLAYNEGEFFEARGMRVEH